MDKVQNLTHQQKIMLIRSRFKTTKDMWLYLTERCKLTPLHSCRFLSYRRVPNGVL